MGQYYTFIFLKWALVNFVGGRVRSKVRSSPKHGERRTSDDRQMIGLNLSLFYTHDVEFYPI